MYKGGYIQGQNTKQADLDSEQHGGEALPSAESYENTPIKETSMKMTSTPMNKKQKNVEVETETAKYDLQFYPRFLYFSQVERDGHLQHQTAVHDGKIDKGYIQKYVRDKKLPFEEIGVSKHTLMETLLRMFSEHYG